jgi:hypothetical protein
VKFSRKIGEAFTDTSEARLTLARVPQLHVMRKTGDKECIARTRAEMRKDRLREAHARVGPVGHASIPILQQEKIFDRGTIASRGKLGQLTKAFEDRARLLPRQQPNTSWLFEHSEKLACLLEPSQGTLERHGEADSLGRIHFVRVHEESLRRTRQPPSRWASTGHRSQG